MNVDQAILDMKKPLIQEIAKLEGHLERNDLTPQEREEIKEEMGSLALSAYLTDLLDDEAQPPEKSDKSPDSSP